MTVKEQHIFDWMQELDHHIGEPDPDYDGVIAIVNEITREAPGALTDSCSTDPRDIIQQLETYRGKV